MSEVKFFYGENIPLEMHKVRIVQKLNLLPVEHRQRQLPKRVTTPFIEESRCLHGYAYRQRG